MKKEFFAKTLVKAITTTIIAGNADTTNLTAAIRDITIQNLKSAKTNVADTANLITESIGDAIRDCRVALSLDDDKIASLEAAGLSVKEQMANAKNLILNAAAAKVSYEGTWTLNARIEVIDDDLSNATTSSRYVDAKATLTAAGLTIPAAGAKRSEWRNLTDAAVKAAGSDTAKADTLRQAINTVRGATEDVVAGTAGKVKCVAKPFGKAIGRKVDGQDARILVLPAKKLYFYTDATKAPTSRQAAYTIEVELDEKGRLVDKDSVTIQ